MFFVILFLSLSIFVVLVNAGVLESKVIVNNDGVHGSKIIVTWFQGDDTINLGPDQCGLNGIPGDNVPYAYKNSDSSSYPNADSDPTGCNYCGGDSACNEGLSSGVEDYYCDSNGKCKYCQACPSGCGFGEDCDTSKGTCNSKCVCDPATCTGTYCSGDDVYSYGCSGDSCSGSYTKTCVSGCINSGGSSTYYSGCSNGKCDSGTSYECRDCKDKVCVLHSCNYDACHTSSDPGCPSGYSSDPSGDGKPDYWNYYLKECQ